MVSEERKEVGGGGRRRREGKKAREGIKEAGQKLCQVGSSRNPRDKRTVTLFVAGEWKKSPVLGIVMGAKVLFPSESMGGAMINKMKGFPGACAANRSVGSIWWLLGTYSRVTVWGLSTAGLPCTSGGWEVQASLQPTSAIQSEPQKPQDPTLQQNMQHPSLLLPCQPSQWEYPLGPCI